MSEWNPGDISGAPPLPDWMLQSYQVDDETLAEALVEAYGVRLIRLAQVLLEDAACAHRSAVETLVWAILNRRQFGNDTCIKVRLFARSLHLCRRVLLQQNFRSAIRRCLPFLSLSPPPKLLPCPVDDGPQGLLEDIHARLGKRRCRERTVVTAREVILYGLAIGLVFLMGWFNGLWKPEQAVKKAPTVLHTQIVTRVVNATSARREWVVEPTRPPPSPDSLYWFYYRVGPEDTLETVAEKAGISPEKLRQLLGISPEAELSPGTMVKIPIQLPMERGEKRTPSPVPARRSPLPLEGNSDIGVILQRIQENRSLWSTLWADILVLRYGPAIYAGPVKAYRKQVWVSQPAQSLVVSGPAVGYPDSMQYVLEGRSYIRHLSEVGYDAGATSTLINDIDLQNFFWRLGRLGRDHSIKVLGSGSVAGRQAIILDSLGSTGEKTTRTWVDASLGVVLRQQRFDGETDRALLEEISVQSIAFDTDFPPEIFHLEVPWPDFFANGYGLLPPDLMTGLFDQDEKTSPYFWENIPILSYQLSSDGSRIAFLAGGDPHPPFYGSYQLYWLDRAQPQRPNPVLLWGSAGPEYAFSPDGRHLVFLGCQGGQEKCHVYRADLDANSYSILFPAAYAGSFTWSPDGEQIMMLAAEDRSLNSGLWVIRAQNGELVSRSNIDWASCIDTGILNVAPDALFPSWEIQPPWRWDKLEGWRVPAQ